MEPVKVLCCGFGLEFFNYVCVFVFLKVGRNPELGTEIFEDGCRSVTIL